jgi:hypothetical protein
MGEALEAEYRKHLANEEDSGPYRKSKVGSK